jgi:hypothetical protein
VTTENGGVKSDGERLLASYLRRRSLPWEYEREVNGRHPDFFVHHPRGAFVAEVHEPEIKLPVGGGWFTSYPSLRRSFEARKAKQIQAVKRAGVPYVGVVVATNCDFDISPDVMAGAMFGDLSITVPVGPDVGLGQPARIGFGQGGRLQEGQLRGVSAVAILERFNPTKWRLNAAVHERLARIPDSRLGTSTAREADVSAAIIRAVKETEDHFLATGVFDPAARLARVTVLHNPYAAHPLGFDVLNGPHDVQWGCRSTEPVFEYGPIFEGVLVREVIIG